jgi:hypothetical protein
MQFIGMKVQKENKADKEHVNIEEKTNFLFCTVKNPDYPKVTDRHIFNSIDRKTIKAY